MELKDKHIAVVCDNYGKCMYVAKVKTISDKELNRLLNEQEQYKNKCEKENKWLKDFCLDTDTRLRKLENKDILLAKSIYDNFVDRGLLNDNEKFQKDFFDFIFNGCELKMENTPNDFQIILRKVGNL